MYVTSALLNSTHKMPLPFRSPSCVQERKGCFASGWVWLAVFYEGGPEDQLLEEGAGVAEGEASCEPTRHLGSFGAGVVLQGCPELG